NTNVKNKFEENIADVYNNKGNFIGNKTIISYDNFKSINDWLITTRKRNNETNLAFMSCKGSDFQTVSLNFIVNEKKSLPHARGTWITDKNLIESSIYYAVRHSVTATWLNDRDQFLFPNYGWQNDTEFQNDCLSFILFSNNIQSQYGINHWIPFKEQEVNAKAKFESNFMPDFIKGKIKKDSSNETLFKDESIAESKPLVFSQEASAVFDAGRELWKYYHAQNDVDINVNASFYDIRSYFQGTNAQGRMNPRSEDATYTKLIGELRNNLSVLADKIKPKVYEYEFLKE
ncbi:MAG: hypothetical protein NT127_05585, partial [Sphingobacteriales bacterium]|nr:hypothetical protein [Sphingobacteriales bacterium]